MLAPFMAALVAASLIELIINVVAAHWLAPLAFFRLRLSRRVILPMRGDGYRARSLARPDYRAVARRFEVGDAVVFRSADGLTYVARRAFALGSRRNLWVVRIDLLETEDGILMTTRLVPTPLVYFVMQPLVIALGTTVGVFEARWDLGLPLVVLGGVGGAILLFQNLFDGHRDTTVALVLERLEAELAATLPK
ncbi:MAG: hypothetical protein OHK0013_44630 [Sandaracinaceae bacterium]